MVLESEQEMMHLFLGLGMSQCAGKEKEEVDDEGDREAWITAITTTTTIIT
jgi:hypothetical protein